MENKLELKSLVELKLGNILKAKEEYIVHQCNCITEHGLGLSEQIFKQFPWADVYTKSQSTNLDAPDSHKIDTNTISKNLFKRIPGNIEIRENKGKFIVNMFGQKYPGKPTMYETREMRQAWFKECLDKFSKYLAEVTNPILGRTSEMISLGVAFPEKIGCGLAGGDWNIYLKMIEEFAKSNTNIKVVIYRL